MSAHQPIRTCIGCHTKKLKQELLRIVRTSEKSLEIDAEQKRPGRGAYLCFERPCFSKAIKRKSFERHLKISVPSEFYEKLQDFLNGRSGTVL